MAISHFEQREPGTDLENGAPIASGRVVDKHVVVVDCMVTVLRIQGPSGRCCVMHECRIGNVDGVGGPIHEVDAASLKP